MSQFANLNLTQIMIHNVFPPNDEGQVDPQPSTSLTVLDNEGLSVLQKRITEVLSNGSHSVEMEIAQTDENSCFDQTCNILSNPNSNDFIVDSFNYAYMHTRAHTSKRWPGGTLVIIEGTVGVSNSKCIIIIKAEKQEGFVEKTINNNLILAYIKNLLLTPQAKLYKIGIFIENTTGSAQIKDTGGFSVFVFDSNISGQNDRKAAKYFYNGFLGLRIPVSSKQITRDFYEFTKDFIDNAPIETEDKIDLHNALYTYLKTDQSNTIDTQTFSQQYFEDTDLKDQYNNYMENKNFPPNAVIKDTGLIKSKLKTRKIKFSSKVHIYAPAQEFEDSVTIIESTDEKTILEIKGQLLNQNS